ncbi:MAG: hypothetical protein WCE23_05970 [Candidatus Binatus sp.]|uniref:hypothetical protein n=1 Tax=Candidatus Binatus sp. TaxID=2811406 RepID=UPI003C72A2B2
MTKHQALSELNLIRGELDTLSEPIFRGFQAAETAAEDPAMAKLLEAIPIDRFAVFKALLMTMSAVEHLATHIEYLLEKSN